jgi:hypothetical protein
VWVVYPGEQEYTLDDRISVVSMNAVVGLARTLSAK